jgi:serine/threonine protein kinase
MASNAMHDSSHSPLQDGRFLLLGALGRGGMATVFNAFDRIEQRMVALKVQNRSMKAGPAHPLSIEFDFWSRLRHPNIVHVHELAIAASGPFTQGTPYLVMEHVEGRPVHEAWPPGRTRPAVVERIAVELLCGLGHVHAAGLVHRDMKPANILIHANGGRRRRIRLTDFGLAAPSGQAEEPGRISGSLPYVSPEAILGLPLDGRADLYGLGIMLYQLATGELPSGRKTAEGLLRWHLSGSPADPGRIRPKFPGRLARFIRRLTRRDRRQRPASTAEALSVLGAAVEVGQQHPPSTVDRCERAKLRLALDATRLGARRLFTMPSCRRQCEALQREVLVWSQIHGLGFFRLRSDSDLLSMALRLLIESGPSARRLISRYSLHRWLPLGMLSDLPVRDLARHDAREASAGGGGTMIVRFILDCSVRRSLALRIEREPSDRLLAAVEEELRRALLAPCRPRPGEGGLLLLDHSCH